MVPNLVEHANVEIHNKSDSENHTEGYVLTYACKEKYELKSGDLTRKCDKNGSWSGISPVCGMSNTFLCYYMLQPKKGNCEL